MKKREGATMLLTLLRRMALYSNRGFILKKIKYRETDYIVTLFLREKGKIAAIVPGARNIRSRKLGKLELLMYNKFTLAEGAKIDKLIEVKVVADYDVYREDEIGRRSLFYIAELLDRYLIDGYQDSLLVDFMEKQLEEQLDIYTLINITKYIIDKEQLYNWEQYIIGGIEEIDVSNMVIYRTNHKPSKNFVQKLEEVFDNRVIHRGTFSREDALYLFALTNGVIENIINKQIRSFNFLFKELCLVT